MKAIPPNIRHKTRMSTFTTSIQNSIGSSSHSDQTRKETKCIQIGKEEVNLSLFAGDSIVYIENSTDSTKRLLDLINEFSKMVGYEVNIHTSRTFLYTNSEISETEIRKNIPFTIATRKRKC